MCIRDRLETILGRNITLSKTALLGIIHNSSKLKIRQNLFADGNVVIVASVTESYKECLVLLFAVTPFAVISPSSVSVTSTMILLSGTQSGDLYSALKV